MPRGYVDLNVILTPPTTPTSPDPDDELRAELSSMIRTVCAQRKIQTAVDLDDYITPEAEKVEDNPDELEEQVLKGVLEAYDEDTTPNNEGEDPELHYQKVTLAEVIAATETRINWVLQQGEGDGNELLVLEKDLARSNIQKTQKAAQGKQTSLMAFFSKKGES